MRRPPGGGGGVLWDSDGRHAGAELNVVGPATVRLIFAWFCDHRESYLSGRTALHASSAAATGTARAISTFASVLHFEWRG